MYLYGISSKSISHPTNFNAVNNPSKYACSSSLNSKSTSICIISLYIYYITIRNSRIYRSMKFFTSFYFLHSYFTSRHFTSCNFFMHFAFYFTFLYLLALCNSFYLSLKCKSARDFILTYTRGSDLGNTSGSLSVYIYDFGNPCEYIFDSYIFTSFYTCFLIYRILDI
ncbi:hypothetical protein D3C71_1395070 [compost metagenome]